MCEFMYESTYNYHQGLGACYHFFFVLALNDETPYLLTNKTHHHDCTQTHYYDCTIDVCMCAL